MRNNTTLDNIFPKSYHIGQHPTVETMPHETISCNFSNSYHIMAQIIAYAQIQWDR